MHNVKGNFIFRNRYRPRTDNAFDKYIFDKYSSNGNLQISTQSGNFINKAESLKRKFYESLSGSVY